MGHLCCSRWMSEIEVHELTTKYIERVLRVLKIPSKDNYFFFCLNARWVWMLIERGWKKEWGMGQGKTQKGYISLQKQFFFKWLHKCPMLTQVYIPAGIFCFPIPRWYQDKTFTNSLCGFSQTARIPHRSAQLTCLRAAWAPGNCPIQCHVSIMSQ